MDKEEKTTIALMGKDLQYIKDDVKDMRDSLKAGYVTQDQFDPIKKFVYGLIAAVCALAFKTFVGGTQ